MGYVSIRLNEEAAGALNQKVRETGMTKSQVVIEGCKSLKDSGEQLLDELDHQSEHPEAALSPEDKKLFESLEPGELPECCQEYYMSGEKCRHWKKEYVNYYGRRVIGYRNTLTGGTNYDYQTLYQQ